MPPLRHTFEQPHILQEFIYTYPGGVGLSIREKSQVPNEAICAKAHESKPRHNT